MPRHLNIEERAGIARTVALVRGRRNRGAGGAGSNRRRRSAYRGGIAWRMASA